MLVLLVRNNLELVWSGQSIIICFVVETAVAAIVQQVLQLETLASFFVSRLG